MQQLKTYTRNGLLIGLIFGISLSALAVLTIYSCDFVFNPGGSYPPAGICERATNVYFPILILFMFAPLFGAIGSILPAIFLTAIFSAIGAFIGRFLQRRHENGSLTKLNKIIISGLLIILFGIILFSMLGIYMDRSGDIKNMVNDYQIDQTAKKTALTPSYLPKNLTKIPLSNEIEDGNINYIYACEKNESGSYSVEIIEEPLGNDNAHYSLSSPWRSNPVYMYTQEKISIGENEGFYYYFKENSNTESDDFETYVKPSRGIYWNNGEKYFEINNKVSSACVYSKEELIKIAKSMK